MNIWHFNDKYKVPSLVEIYLTNATSSYFLFLVSEFNEFRAAILGEKRIIPVAFLCFKINKRYSKNPLCNNQYNIGRLQTGFLHSFVFSKKLLKEVKSRITIVFPLLFNRKA